MRQINFAQDEIEQLKHERLHHPHYIVRRRMMSLYLKAMGYRHKDICSELNISSPCLREHLDRYINGGIEALKHLGYTGKANLLDENKDVIISHLEAKPPGTLLEAQAMIYELTGIKRSIPQISQFLKKTNIFDAKSSRYLKKQT